MKNIIMLLTAVTLVSCDSKTFEAPVGYLTVPVYSSDIEAVNAAKNAK
jgi:hypothetical protein